MSHLVVQPLRTVTPESAALGRKLLVARAASDAVLLPTSPPPPPPSSSSSSHGGSGPRRAPQAGYVAKSIPTASVRIVNRSSANVFFKIQSKKAGKADFCVQPENGTLRAQSAVIVAIACVSDCDPSEAVFRCKWGERPESAQSSSKFQLQFLPTLVSSESKHNSSSSIENNTDANTSGGESQVQTKPSQAGWPPWERSDYSGDGPSAEDVDAERSAAYKFIAKYSTPNEIPGTAPGTANNISPTNSKKNTSSCCGGIKSLLMQCMFTFAMLWALAFSFPERTGGLAGIFTLESIVLPSFLVGMLAQSIRAHFFGGKKPKEAAGKSKSD